MEAPESFERRSIFGGANGVLDIGTKTGGSSLPDISFPAFKTPTIQAFLFSSGYVDMCDQIPSRIRIRTSGQGNEAARPE